MPHLIINVCFFDEGVESKEFLERLLLLAEDQQVVVVVPQVTLKYQTVLGRYSGIVGLRPDRLQNRQVYYKQMLFVGSIPMGEQNLRMLQTDALQLVVNVFEVTNP